MRNQRKATYMPVSKKPAKRPPSNLGKAKPTLSRMWRHTTSEEIMMMLLPHSALSDMIRGESDQFHWNTVTFALSITQELAQEFAPELCPEIQRALDSLHASQRHFLSTGRWVMLACAAIRIGDALHYADALHKYCTRAEQRAAGARMIKNNMHRLGDIGITSKEHVVRWVF